MIDLETSIVKTVIGKALGYLVGLLPFLWKKDATEVKEFDWLVIDQYELLMGRPEKMLKDYFELSSKVKEMHAEVVSLREKLLEVSSFKYRLKECERREVVWEKSI